MFRRTRRPLRRCAVRLHRAIEGLEVRRLFAVPIVVNTTLDETTPADGLTSLRDAITQAQTVVGGAIDNLGTLALGNCTLSKNTAVGGNGGSAAAGGGLGGSAQGGAVYSAGNLTVTDCLFVNNLAIGGRAGKHLGGDSDTSSGEGAGGDIG